MSGLPHGISIRPLDTVDEVFRASRVLGAVWGGDDAGMPPNLLRALAHSGNYVVGLYARDHDGDDEMIGASAAFFAAPGEKSLHSHITGILPAHQRRGLGRGLKEHQREWALARGVERITWTFDPLVARNAHFNLSVLGATADEYLVDHYGPMSDGVNRGDETDRLLARWELAAPASAPGAGEVERVVEVPPDIEKLRRDDPSAAARWRIEVREQFADALGQGLVVAGFRGGYLFAHGA